VGGVTVEVAAASLVVVTACVVVTA